MGVLTIAALTAIVYLIWGKPSPVKIMALIVLYTGFVEWTVFYKLMFFADKTNVHIYGFFNLAEPLSIAYYFRQLIQSVRVQKIIRLFMYLYPVVWYIFVFFVFEYKEWNSYVYIVGGLFTLLWAVVYCYELLTVDNPVQLRQHSEFWIAIGLIFFQVCSLPYLGMFRYITEHFVNVAWVLQELHQVINIILFMLYTYAFICQLTITRRS